MATKSSDSNELLIDESDTGLAVFVQNFHDPEDLRCMSPEALLELLEEEHDCPITFLIWRRP